MKKHQEFNLGNVKLLSGKVLKSAKLDQHYVGPEVLIGDVSNRGLQPRVQTRLA